MIRRMFAAALAAVTALSAPASAEPFTVIALGDMPYGDPAEVYPTFEALIAEVNALEPRLVLHIGDTKSGSTPCSDQALDDQLNFLNRFAAPTIYTPGDNEWTDCYRESAGAFDPLDRLDYIRRTYFDDPGTSFGTRTMTLGHQGAEGYPENTRAMVDDVMIIAAHVVGSNNNFEPSGIAAIKELFARDAATIRWMEEGFDAATARNAAAVILVIHANMFEFDFGEPFWNSENWLRHSGFKAFGTALKARAAAFGKPVLLVYGDSHVFRQSRPFPKAAHNVLALEVPGARDMHAVEITVDRATRGVFSMGLVLNPALSK